MQQFQRGLSVALFGHGSASTQGGGSNGGGAAVILARNQLRVRVRRGSSIKLPAHLRLDLEQVQGYLETIRDIYADIAKADVELNGDLKPSTFAETLGNFQNRVETVSVQLIHASELLEHTANGTEQRVEGLVSEVREFLNQLEIYRDFEDTHSHWKRSSRLDDTSAQSMRKPGVRFRMT